METPQIENIKDAEKCLIALRDWIEPIAAKCAGDSDETDLAEKLSEAHTPLSEMRDR